MVFIGLGCFGLRNWFAADEFEFAFVEDFAVEVDDVGGDGTVNIVRLGRIFTIWVGLFVDFVDFPGWGDGSGGGPVFLELQEAALELGDRADADLSVFAKFGDSAVTGEGFLGG